MKAILVSIYESKGGDPEFTKQKSFIDNTDITEYRQGEEAVYVNAIGSGISLWS